RGLGFCYFTDTLVDDAARMMDALRNGTGVNDWVGTVGTGVLATGVEYQGEPALVAMVADLDDYAVFSGRAPLRPQAPHWTPSWAVVHADPSAPDVPGLLADMAAKLATGYLVGGLSSSRSRTVQVANDVFSGGLSGAAFGASVAVATRVTQGCVPISPRLRVTEAEENIIARLEGRPALEVLQEVLAGRRLALLVGLLPAPGSRAGDLRGDYTARNLIGADPKSGLIAIGDVVEPGSEIVFCKRDSEAARQDLGRIAAELAAQAPRPRGALYFSCVARGEHMFGERGAELRLVGSALGEVPLVGFFCNGEISSDRLYGYTGVLTVFP
ncbi:MAG: FIST signal transduction protein, partial [Betaproteobacteria bacterium]